MLDRLAMLAPLCLILAATDGAGTLDDPIIDSAMTEAEAFAGLSPDCPPEIRERQELLTIDYYGLDGKVHRGQVVVDRDLAADVRQVFVIAREHRFPIESAIPVSAPRFRKDERWDDDLSMEANNTSSFNYRPVTGGGRLSNHAYGRAIDVNPGINQYVKGSTVLPPGATYDPSRPGTITEGDPIVKAFLDRGWEWGGHWKSPKDYQHFEKPAR